MHRIDPQLVEALTALVSEAGRAILAVRLSALAIREKADQSPVTAADEAAHAVILDGLARLLPGMPVVSEESTGPQPAVDARAGFVLVDPLDGTREFIAGRNEYTVNVALIEAGQPVFGLVFAPALGLLYRGSAGALAERLVLAAGEPPVAAQQRTPIHVRPQPAGGPVAAISRSHHDPETEGMLVRLPVAARMACGSSLKFGLLAEGTADVYPRLAPIHEWDIAAGHAVLVAAGGTVVRPDGTALTYGRAQSGFVVPGFIAWGGTAPASS